MILRELIAKFGIDFDDRGAKKAEGAVTGLKNGLTNLRGVLATAGVGISLHLIKSQYEAADAIAKSAKQIGISTDSLQALRFAGERSGASVEGMSVALRYMQKNLVDAQQGTGMAIDALRTLGITLDREATADPQQMFIQIAEAMSQMDNQAEKTNAAMRIFGRSGADLLPLLDEGADGVKALFDEFKALGGGLSSDFLKSAEDVMDQMTNVNVAMASFKSGILLDLAPFIVDASKKFTEFSAKLRAIDEDTGAVTAALRTFGITAAAVAAVFLVSWIAAAAVPLLIGAGIVALILLVEDFLTFLDGGDSAIGMFFDEIGWGSENVRKALHRLAEAPGEIVEFWSNAGDSLAEVWRELSRIMGEVWEDIKTSLSDWLDSLGLIWDGFWSTAADVVKNQLSAALDSVKSTLESIPGIGAAINLVSETFGGTVAAPTPAGAGAAGTAGNSTAIRNEVTVNVQGGASPRETGAQAQRGVSEALRQANRDAERALTRVAG